MFSIACGEETVECCLEINDKFLELVCQSINNHIPVGGISHLLLK